MMLGNQSSENGWGSETENKVQKPKENQNTEIQDIQEEKTQASDFKIEDFKTTKQDTGSSQFQIALLTQRIRQLTGHFKIHKKDFHSQVGLMKIINRRKKLLSYLKKKNSDAYKAVVQKLGLRK